MKDIIVIVRERYGKKVSDQLKLRLRGKGSGFKEGQENKESEESLHLCVSAKHQRAFSLACVQVEKLLRKIYNEYVGFVQKNHKDSLHDVMYLIDYEFNDTIPQMDN